MDFFEAELDKINRLVEVPLMQRRQHVMKDDYKDELQEVYVDVKEIEEHLAKTISISRFIIDKHK